MCALYEQCWRWYSLTLNQIGKKLKWILKYICINVRQKIQDYLEKHVQKYYSYWHAEGRSCILVLFSLILFRGICFWWCGSHIEISHKMKANWIKKKRSWILPVAVQIWHFGDGNGNFSKNFSYDNHLLPITIRCL